MLTRWTQSRPSLDFRNVDKWLNKRNCEKKESLQVFINFSWKALFFLKMPQRYTELHSRELKISSFPKVACFRNPYKLARSALQNVVLGSTPILKS